MATLIFSKTQEVIEYGEPDRAPGPSSLLVFDDKITTTTAQYTSPDFNYVLAASSRVRIQAVADDISGTSPTLTVQLEHSADERNFVNVGTVADISAGIAVGGTSNLISTTTLGVRAQHHAARLRVQLGGTSPQAHVKIWVTMRGKA